ncbi:MAG: InlB B-repeat-containing protein [Paludibacteraceae bacterium]|nr:InlB B-repeat-containing protein [Paludibacteraceae bacterium]
MKKILFLNTTKLAVLSAALLLAVFCTIGMSFTPAEEGENVGNPNDSTYVTGPRRGHATGQIPGCSGTSELDYFKATAVTMGNGTVSLADGDDTSDGGFIRSTNQNPTSLATEGASVSIEWHCNESDKTTGTDKNHKHTFKWKAEPSAGYNFKGWSTTGNESDIFTNDNPCEFTMQMESNTYNTDNEYSSANKAYETKFYAFFEKQKVANITLGASSNGQYDYSYSDDLGNTISGTITDAKQEIKTGGTINLKATPAPGYKFFGWYTDDPENYISYKEETGLSFQEDATLYAKFISENTAIWLIKETNKHYYDLHAAIDACGETETRTIVLINDGVVPAGDYTIPSNVALLVPYDNDYSLDDVVVRILNGSITCFRTLTLATDAKIIVDGRLEVGGNQNIVGNMGPSVGAPRAHGKIRMAAGSSITLNEGSHLYCWGYIVGVKNDRGEIIGEGTIVANSSSTVHECLQLTDWKGGGISTQLIDNDYKYFPVNQYYVQNIEVPITFYSGAYNLVSTGVYMSKQQGLSDNQPFISTTTSGKGLLRLSSGYLNRDYKESTDRIEYSLNGDVDFVNLNVNLSITGQNVDLKSGNYYLPFTNNMILNIRSGSMTAKAAVMLCAGSEVSVAKGATLNLEDFPIYVFDKDEWVAFKLPSKTGPQLFPLPYANETSYQESASGTKKAFIRTLNNIQDAKLCIDGTLKIGGSLYTSKSGANICSTGTGKVIFTKDAPDATTITQLKTYTSQTNWGITTYELTWSSPEQVTSAQLHNGKEWYGDNWINNEWYKEGVNLEYLATAGVSASTTIQYANNHWGWMEIWKDHDGTILNINNTCTQTNNSSAYEHNVLPEGYTFIGWSTEVSDTNQEVIHTAQYTYGPELDIVDADGTNLTINANGWASSGWSYTINGTEYGKDDKAGKEKYRRADRTLVIPYTGTSGASLPIAVLDKDGKPICRHIYKVPFVYDSNTEMSGTDENSIVFVKSGTLTVGTASAKEIYVAPGAELKVNGTLTVGKLVLRTTPYKAAVLTIETGGSIALTDGGQVYYSRISPNSEQYYQFGLPLKCPLANVKMSNTGKLGGSQPKYGTAWILKSYSESSRAQNGISNEGANWSLLKNIDNIGVITAGVGYEMFSNSNYYREFYFPVNLSEAKTQVSVQYTDGTIGAEHNGWNIITSPLTSRANVPIIDPATDFKVCWLNENGSYRQELPTVIPPAIPFSCQVSPKEGTLTFDANLTFAAPAPRKQSAAEALTETEWVHLDIFDAYGEGDETSLFVHPTRFEQTYKTGIDMAKQSLTASRAILYTTHAYGDMAFAGVADSLLENGIDLVVYSPSAQELTFSLRENKFLNRLEYLWLADNETGERTDLLMDDYTFRADAGTAKGRFVLNGRFKAPQISTGIGNTQTDYNIYAIGNNIAISGVELGTPIYVFDAVGHMIYTTAATTAEVIVPAPCAGVYMLSVGGQTAKLVVNQ